MKEKSHLLSRLLQLGFVFVFLNAWMVCLSAKPATEDLERSSRAHPELQVVAKLAQFKQKLAHLTPLVFGYIKAFGEWVVDYSLLKQRIEQGKWNHLEFYLLYSVRKILFVALIFLTLVAGVNGLILIKMGENYLKAFVPFWAEWVYCRRLAIPKGVVFARLGYQVVALMLGFWSYYVIPFIFLLLGWLVWAREWRYIKWRRLAYGFGYRAPKVWLPCYLPLYVAWHILFTDCRFRPSKWKPTR